jgi:UDP-N-acetyl-D-mannosaminuronic acid dehydrogenase
MTPTPTYDVCIVGGLGHIGLPLGIAFADQGLNVALVDVNQAYADQVRAGQMPFIEYGAEPVLARVLAQQRLHIHLSPEAVGQSAAIVICLGTPVDEYMNPKTRQFLDIFRGLARYLQPSQLVVVRSSVFPHTIDQMLRVLHEKQADAAWQVAYCPERIVQGYAMQELYQLPQIVSGVTEQATEAAAQLFSRLAPEIVRTSLQEAELVKLFANAWRYIKFAVANQFYMICEQNGVNYDSVRRAMRQGYERAQDIPGAGFAAGPCLLKDTMQLANYTGNNFQLGHSAMLVNEGLPNFLVQQLGQRRTLAGLRVGILGMAFKADIDDVRDSLSFKLAKLLQFAGCHVKVTDEYAHHPSLEPLADVLAHSQVLFIGVPHAAYRSLQLPPTVEEVVDLWGAVPTPRC